MTVTVWWISLSAVSALNLCALVLLARAVLQGRVAADAATYAICRRQLALAAIFTLGCAFRSFLPRADVQRICVVDSWLSSVLVGRSVATVAELCLVAQWALVLRVSAAGWYRPTVVKMAGVIVPLIVFAEICSWYATVTTNYLGNVIEESTWAVVAALVTLGLVLGWPRRRARQRRFARLAIALSGGYLAFLVTVDVPMYLARWRADEKAGRRYLGIIEGLHDVATRWVVTRSWEDWREEMPWMSLYFTLGVWMSMALVRTVGAPPRLPGVPPSEPGRVGDWERM